MRSYRFISLIVTLLISIVQLSAQTVDVTGTVYDETGKPLSLCAIHTSESRSTFSDSLGRYSIPVSENKDVEIRFEYLCYKDVVLHHSPNGENPLKTDVRMELDPTIRIIELDKRPEICSNCGSKVLPIVYGYPTEDDIRLQREGKILLGGSAIGSANYGCVSCQQTYHVKESESLLVVIDGIVNPESVKNQPLELLLRSFPFISEEEVESLEVAYLKDEDFSGISCYGPHNDILLITTPKESDIHDFTLNGKSVHKRKGIKLGFLLDEKLLKQQIKKEWRINPNRIESLVVDGREIRITTK